MHDTDAPSPWFVRHAALVPVGATLLDVACGYGRHAKLFAARGVRVTAVDRDAHALASLAGIGNIVTECRDLEGEDRSPDAWPYAAESFDAVLVCNYLWRPTLARLIASIRPGGVLLYETFLAGHERFGKPSRAEFLLRERELPALVGDRFTIIDYFEGELRDPATDRPYARKAMLAARRNDS